ncbi:hypothetical protein SCHPADRAFT_913900 [Schizopora paradoxa]|uniref:Core-binding (CB) domain-containing protein n=1 Tax=Schizopora paradoxa TaxID=27342 RepID=A0A0H2RXH0_9AGAM|nr:hypothetical protein SCHPADRAFT_913900 [Schizopora paradoxa]
MPRNSHARRAIPHRPRPPNFSQLSKLSPTSIHNINRALAHGWSSSTKKNYASVIRRFKAFCEDEGFSPHDIFPASELALCAFAASHAGRRAGTTARNNLAAVKAWHSYYNAPWNGSARLRYVLSGVQNLAPPSSSRPQRPPVTLSMLNLLVQRLDRNHPLDACVLATAFTAFWGQSSRK